jgi:integrase
MSSVYKRGKSYLLQVGVGRARRVRRLGDLSVAGAKTVQHHAAQIELSRKAAVLLPAATVAWLGEITDELHVKLVALGLVAPRDRSDNGGIPTTIGRLWDDFLGNRPDLKKWTRSNLEQTKYRCIEFFKLKPVSAITKGDAKDFRRWLVEKGYSQATVSGFVNKTRQLFNDSIDHGLLTTNPFRKVGGGSQVNEERQFFVSREAIERVMAVAPNDEWRLLIALGRYGGLRIPSEVVGLKISNIDLERGRITIASPKTEKQGKPKRLIPLWPELRPLILKVLQKASADQTRLLPFILPGYNPHTQFVRLIKNAGLVPWPKVWQNLRSTRETELLKDFPIHVVCGWIGNTERIARRHYLQITEADFDHATGGQQRAAESAAIPSGEYARLAQVEKKEPRFPHQNAGNAVPQLSSCAQDRT